MKSSNKSTKHKKELLLKTIGKIVKKHRLQYKKGILLHAYEFDIPSSSLNLIEHGIRDSQISTLWKIANSFNMSFGEFISEIEEQLPNNFNLIDDK